MGGFVRQNREDWMRLHKRWSGLVCAPCLALLIVICGYCCIEMLLEVIVLLASYHQKGPCLQKITPKKVLCVTELRTLSKAKDKVGSLRVNTSATGSLWPIMLTLHRRKEVIRLYLRTWHSWFEIYFSKLFHGDGPQSRTTWLGSLENNTGKQTGFPSSPSTSQSFSWSPYACIQQVFSVCSGITVCDFSLTSQAALWHRGVIVSGGWRPFCHGRVEKDKASPQPPRLAERCDLVSPAWWRIGTGTRAGGSQAGRGPVGFETTLENGVVVDVIFLNNGLRLAKTSHGTPAGVGGFSDAGLTRTERLPPNKGPLLANHPQKPRHIGSILSQVYSPRRLDQLARTMAALSQGEQTPKGQRCDLIHAGIIVSAPAVSVCLSTGDRARNKVQQERAGGSGGVDSLTLKCFSAPNQKQKRHERLRQWGSPHYRMGMGWEWQGCRDGRSGRSALLPSKISA